MSDYSLAQITALIDPSCFPPSASKSVKYALINKARNMLYNSPGGEIWDGTNVTLMLSVVIQPDTNWATLTLPRGLETLLGIYDCTRGGLAIQNEWYEFIPGPAPRQWSTTGVRDMGQGFCGVVNIPSTGAQLSFQTTATESGGLSIVVTGLDLNGNKMVDTIGVPTISGNVVTTPGTFYAVTSIILPVTAGDLICTLALSPSIFYARYQAGETFPNYRRYSLGSNVYPSSLKCACKRRYIDLVSDNDTCDISVVVALENALRAYRYQQNTDYVKAGQAMGEAVGYLNGALARYESDSEMGDVSIDYQTSPGRISNLL